MRDRKKRNIIIGVLCCLLVVMGIGYAILSQTLNISGIANMKGDWNVKITNVELVGTNGMAEDVSHTFTDTTATIKGKMYMPGDSAEYKVTVANVGNIDAKIASITPTVENAINDIKFTNDAVEDRILKSGETYQFNIKTTFDINATSLPEKGAIPTFKLTLQYVQYDREQVYNITRTATNDACFTIDSNGAITGYDYSCGTSVVVPDEIDNVVVKSLEEKAFVDERFNITEYYSGGDDSFFVAEDQASYDLLMEYFGTQGLGKAGLQKSLEDTAKSEGKTIEEAFKDISTEVGTEIKSVDDYINYVIKTLEASGNFVLRKDLTVDLTGKTETKYYIAKDGDTILYNEAGVSIPLTELDLSKTKHLESVKCFYNLPKLKRLNLSGVSNFTYTTRLNYTLTYRSDGVDPIMEQYPLEELIIDADSYQSFQKTDTDSTILFYLVSIQKLVILDGKTTHTINKTNLFDYCIYTDAWFPGDTKIKQLVIEDGITEIGEGAFRYFDLEKVSLPNSIVSIGSKAFADNRETLTDNGLGKLPKSLVNLSPDAFYEDTLLTKIILTSKDELDGYPNGGKISLDDTQFATIVYER